MIELARSWPRTAQAVLLVLLCAAAGVISAGCRRTVSLEVAGPEELDGARVLIDGRPGGYFTRVATDEKTAKELGHPVTGAVASVRVPEGTHELRIEKEGYRPIVRKLHYSNHGSEDYIGLTREELIKEST